MFIHVIIHYSYVPAAVTSLNYSLHCGLTPHLLILLWSLQDPELKNQSRTC